MGGPLGEMQLLTRGHRGTPYVDLKHFLVDCCIKHGTIVPILRQGANWGCEYQLAPRPPYPKCYLLSLVVHIRVACIKYIYIYIYIYVYMSCICLAWNVLGTVL